MPGESGPALDEGMVAPGETVSKVVLANDLLRLEISERGGMITSARLNDYNSFAKGDTDTSRVELIREADSRYGFTFTTASRRFDTSNYRFTPTEVNDSVVVMTMDFAKACNPKAFAAVDTAGQAGHTFFALYVTSGILCCRCRGASGGYERVCAYVACYGSV